MANEDPILLNPSTDTVQQNRQYIASGGANDESGTQSTGSGDRANTVQGSSGANAGGTTQAGKAETPTATVYQASPDKRQYNPLGQFSSYTYQITLYMITPDAYDRFIDSGRQKIDVLNQSSAKGQGGALIICQSGGINNSSTKRASGFQYDFYIDDLKIDSYVNGKSTQSATNVTDITFNIIEPLGFSFITNLKRAADQLQAYCTTKNYKDLQNPTRQFYILGLRFQGYDKDGKIMTGKEKFLGQQLDPSQSDNSSGIFERYYDIIIRGIKFKINGQATVYNISANSMSPGIAMGLKRGFSTKDIQVTSDTVGGAVTQFLDILSREQEDMLNKNQIKIKNTYNVVFQDSEIANASIVNKADLTKFSYRMPVQKTSESTEAAASKKNTPANPTEKQLKFATNTPILQAIENIISNSSYMRNAVALVYSNNLNKSDEPLPNDARPEISWYNISAKVNNAEWDPKVGDYAFNITYFIKKYVTPIFLSAYAKIAPRYPGPHKVYEYWYTGENREILNYEQSLDNAYFNVAVVPSGTGQSQGGPTDVTTVPGKRTDQSRLSGADQSLETINTYVTSLYDPGSYAKVKMTIIGDPDFLMQDSPGSIKAVYDRFYGDDGFTINPNGGQVFIEINFKEADDYDTNTGVLSINESIRFWAYPSEIQNRVKGVSYMVLRVTSNFRAGKFTQDLECLINTFPDATSTSSNARPADPYANETAKFARQGTRSVNPNANEYEISGSQAISPYASLVNVTTQTTGLKVVDDVLESALSRVESTEIVNVTNPTNLASSITSPTGGAPNTGLIILDGDAQGTTPKSIPEQGREVNSNVQSRDPPSKYDVIRSEIAQRQSETLSVIDRLRRNLGQ
jgi:hypothetical protein